MNDMSEQEIVACSDLFGSSYGKYDMESPIRPGLPIRMGIEQYRKRYCAPGVYLVRAMDNDRQVGHALYIRKVYKPYGTMTWVVQLVVDKDYRRRGIASRLLRSIWGFSDDFAWGLASANPCTVKTLESVTFRKCKWKYICENMDAIQAIGADTSFVADDSYVVGEAISQVNTQFFADNSDYIKEIDYEKELGKLRPGHEWLAFTFREQPINRRSFNTHFGRMMIDLANRGYTVTTFDNIIGQLKSKGVFLLAVMNMNLTKSLPAKCILRDKRYTGEEIREIVGKAGFTVKDFRYVQAGHFDSPLESLDIKAKEICVVCIKP